jgi:2-polyprenyl-3-methyl-5-hydroxy-6-metoxy-1,4-benzoquinol methylase
MKFDTDIYNFLNGLKFSNGLNIEIAEKNTLQCNRLDLIKSLCKDKNIIHLGCTDHLNLIDEKIQKGTYLHDILCHCSNKCIGVDINCEAIDYLKKKYKYQDLICADIIKDEIDEITSHKWDYLVMGEILEHVDEPFKFLEQIHNIYSSCIDYIIITVPNALSLQNMIQAFHNKELINTDHRYWFTPYTLGKIVTNAGMKVEEFYFCNSSLLSTDFKHRILYSISPRKIITNRYPATRINLIMIAKI